MMPEKRRHKRFMLDLMEVNGRLGLTDKVEIIDISFGRVSLKADRRLNIGKEFLFTLRDKGNRKPKFSSATPARPPARQRSNCASRSSNRSPPAAPNASKPNAAWVNAKH